MSCWSFWMSGIWRKKWHKKWNWRHAENAHLPLASRVNHVAKWCRGKRAKNACLECFASFICTRLMWHVGLMESIGDYNKSSCSVLHRVRIPDLWFLTFNKCQKWKWLWLSSVRNSIQGFRLQTRGLSSSWIERIQPQTVSLGEALPFHVTHRKDVPGSVLLIYSVLHQDIFRVWCFRADGVISTNSVTLVEVDVLECSSFSLFSLCQAGDN